MEGNLYRLQAKQDSTILLGLLTMLIYHSFFFLARGALRRVEGGDEAFQHYLGLSPVESVTRRPVLGTALYQRTFPILDRSLSGHSSTGRVSLRRNICMTDLVTLASAYRTIRIDLYWHVLFVLAG